MPTVKVDSDRLRECFRQREAAQWSWALGELALGLFLTFAIPLSLAGGSSLRWRGAAGWITLAIAFVFMLIAYISEWRCRGGELVQQLRDIGSGSLGENWNERSWRYGRIELALWWEVWLFVPRTVFEGWGTLRMIRAVSRVDRTHAARLLSILLERTQQVNALQGAAGIDSGLSFGQAMAYLLFYDWIALSDDTRRAWAGTETRQALGLAV